MCDSLWFVTASAAGLNLDDTTCLLLSVVALHLHLTQASLPGLEITPPPVAVPPPAPAGCIHGCPPHPARPVLSSRAPLVDHSDRRAGGSCTGEGHGVVFEV